VPVPDFADPRAPYVQIADHLREQIADGRYQPGDKLPSISALVAEYGSATETVRRALSVLKAQGLVETHSTRGTFVLRPPGEPEPDPAVARLSAELADLREMVRDHEVILRDLRQRVPGPHARQQRGAAEERSREQVS
jgi:DNA-binding GntR family transcriptional regulator